MVWKDAAHEGIRELLVRQARFGPKVKAVVQTRDKASRVHALSVPVESGAFQLRGGRVRWRRRSAGCSTR